MLGQKSAMPLCITFGDTHSAVPDQNFTDAHDSVGAYSMQSQRTTGYAHAAGVPVGDKCNENIACTT